MDVINKMFSVLSNNINPMAIKFNVEIILNIIQMDLSLICAR
jgi:hypothetical protein